MATFILMDSDTFTILRTFNANSIKDIEVDHIIDYEEEEYLSQDMIIYDDKYVLGVDHHVRQILLDTIAEHKAAMPN